jgi:hypothetical protein
MVANMKPETRAELVNLASELIVDTVRDEPLIAFHRREIGHPFPDRWGKGDPAEAALTLAEAFSVVQEASELVQSRYPSMQVEVKSVENNYFWGVDVSPRPGRDWVDVLGDIHGSSEPDPARVLTHSARELAERIDSGEFTKGFLSELSVRHRIRCYGYSRIDQILRELDVKLGLKLKIETKDDKTAKRQRRLMKFHVIARANEPPPLCPPAPNPVFHYTGEPAGVFLAFKHFIQKQLLELRPIGAGSQILWAIASLKTYWHCFPDYGEGPGKHSYGLGALLKGCVPHPDVILKPNLGYHEYVWTVNCEPKRPWAEILPEVEAMLAEPDVAGSYGLSAEAANLLRWARGQPKGSLQLGCTPIVEEAIRDDELRLGAEWPKENLPALVEILCDEVTSRTPFQLKPIRWISHREEQTRVRIAEAPTTERATAAMVSTWLHAQGIRRSSQEIEQALEQLKQSLT